MLIYIVTTLHGNKYAGPSYSVPRTISELSKMASIVWINMLPSYSSNLKATNIIYISYEQYKKIGISSILLNYGKPEVVIFEELYNINFCYLARKFEKQSIPYMVTPRGCLCDDAQSKKAIKKRIGNCLFFNRFVKKASSIRYLTEQEAKDSGVKWNKSFCVIPNGTDVPDNIRKRAYEEPIRGVFIGRIDIFHKGLDLFIEAFANWIAESNIAVKIDIYGADSVGDRERLTQLVEKFHLSDKIKTHDAVYDKLKTEVLLNHDFFILTSRFEGHPMGLLEALAFGLPSLVTEGSNMASEIKKYKCGWTSETTIEGIITSLKEFEKDKLRFGEYSKNAIALAKEYRWEIIAKKLLEQIYNIR